MSSGATGALPPWARALQEMAAPMPGAAEAAGRADAPAAPLQAPTEAVTFAERLRAHAAPVEVTAPQIAAVFEQIRLATQPGGVDASQLDPTAPLHTRMQAFAQIVRPAIQQGLIHGIERADAGTLATLYNAVFGWGEAIQPLLDDPSVTEIKIGASWAVAEGHHGRILLDRPYPDASVPRARLHAYAQLRGLTLDAAHPTRTLALSHKTRLHGVIPPLVPDDEVLLVIRRGRERAWTLDDLVERQALAPQAAALMEELLQAWPSVLVSGAQNSGKTTFLECALNALDSGLHLVLVEDETDEVRLHAPLVTRLQVRSSLEAFETVRRETLRMSPDYVVPCEVRGAEAGAVIAVADNGRPTMTTIHGVTPETALRRLALYAAADVPQNVFAGKYDLALAVATEAFHLVVHLHLSRRLGRRIVASAHLCDGVAADGTPRLLPLISTAPTDDACGVQWTCHAQVVAGQLVWADGAQQTPARWQALLADVPLQAVPPLLAVAGQALPPLLDDIRRALRDPASGADLVARLDRAAQIDTQHPEVWELAATALRTHAGVQRVVAEQVAAQVARVTDALAAGDRAGAQAALRGPFVPLLHLALAGHAEWQQLQAVAARMAVPEAPAVEAEGTSTREQATAQLAEAHAPAPSDVAERAQAALQTAFIAYGAGEYRRGWAALAAVPDADVPAALLGEWAEAQQSLLTAWAARGDAPAWVAERLEEQEGMRVTTLPTAGADVAQPRPLPEEPAAARATPAPCIGPYEPTVARHVGQGLGPLLDDPAAFLLSLGATGSPSAPSGDQHADTASDT